MALPTKRTASRVLLLSVLVLGACQSTLDVNPAPNSPPFPASSARIQSETAFGVARRPEGGRQIVLAFNDYSESIGLPGEIFVDGTQNDVSFARNASLLGWAFSRDDGTTWARGGKIRPATGFPVILSDPAVAVDPSNPSIVYMSALAVSETAWASVPASSDDAPRRAEADSFCVARSDDGGTTFPLISCTQVNFATSPERGLAVLADLPVIAVDGVGCLWVAVEEKRTVDATLTRLFRAQVADGGTCLERGWMNLQREIPEAVPDSGIPEDELPLMAIQPLEVRPRLRGDALGNIWLMTEALPSPSRATHSGILRRFHVPGPLSAVHGWDQLTGVFAGCMDTQGWTGTTTSTSVTVGTPDPTDPDRRQAIKGASRHDFDVRLAADLSPILRFAIANQRPDSKLWFLQVVEYAGVCDDRALWSTIGLAGSQTQPSLRHTVRDPVTGSPGMSDWSLMFLNSGGVVDPTRPQVQILSATVGPSFIPITSLSPSAYPVCATTNEYWGDYAEGLPLATGPTTRTRLAATSDSRGALCSRGARHALPQHVRVTRW